MKEFKINEIITLRLKDKNTEIYLYGNLFSQCKHLVISIPSEEIKDFNEFESIDQVSDIFFPRYYLILDKNPEFIAQIDPETEFWGHCSNLQAWVESGYNTDLLDRKLAFPILKALVEAGDLKAKKVFSNEITRRIKRGYFPVIEYLVIEGYLSYLNNSQLIYLFEVLIEQDTKYDLFKIIENLNSQFPP